MTAALRYVTRYLPNFTPDSENLFTPRNRLGRCSCRTVTSRISLPPFFRTPSRGRLAVPFSFLGLWSCREVVRVLKIVTGDGIEAEEGASFQPRRRLLHTVVPTGREKCKRKSGGKGFVALRKGLRRGRF